LKTPTTRIVNKKALYIDYGAETPIVNRLPNCGLWYFVPFEALSELQIAASGAVRHKSQMLADASKSAGIVVMGRCYVKVAESMTSSLWVAVTSNGIAWPNDPWMHALPLGKDLSQMLSSRSPCLQLTG
jgi:hypothetical protein